MAFAARGCRLAPLSPPKMLSLLRNRTLWLWGDSSALQQAIALRCQLADEGSRPDPAMDDACWVSARDCTPEGAPNATAGEVRPAPAPPSFRHVVDAAEREGLRCFAECDVYERYGARVCWVGVRTTLLGRSRWGCWAAARPQDVVVANVGVWFNEPAGLVGAVTNFSRFWRRARDVEGRALPLLLWRESAAQHFDGPRGGNFDPTRPSWDGSANPCVPVPLPVAAAANWRNAFTVPDLEAAGVPILRVWEHSVPMHRSHPLPSTPDKARSRERIRSRCTQDRRAAALHSGRSVGARRAAATW